LIVQQARGTNASNLNPTTELVTMNTDIRQIRALVEQATGNAITKAVSNGDMTPEDASKLDNLLGKSTLNLTPANL
jgi:hypothetical protein